MDDCARSPWASGAAMAHPPTDFGGSTAGMNLLDLPLAASVAVTATVELIVLDQEVDGLRRVILKR